MHTLDVAKEVLCLRGNAGLASAAVFELLGTDSRFSVDGIISKEFQTLVNPGRRIPSFISELTGITDEMVAGAPFFEDIAQELHDCLDGRVIVAHNVAFDWRFISAQLGDAIGQLPNGPRLCTVQGISELAALQRLLLPKTRRSR